MSVLVMAGCGVEPQDPGADEAGRELRALAPQLDPTKLHEGRSGLALDLRDEDHRRFAEARLHHVGKTRASSPTLFARMEAQSKADKYAPVNNVLNGDCNSPLEVTQDPFDVTKWTARIITSCFAGASYSYVDLFWWNAATGQMLAYDYAEDFTDPRDLTLTITADPNMIGSVIYVDSMTINSRGAEDLYYFDSIIQSRPLGYSAMDSINDPRDKDNSGSVVICLDRGGSDCDYPLTGTSGQILVPMNMEFVFPRNVTSIVNAVAQVHMTNDGGICQTNSLTSHIAIANNVVKIQPASPIAFGTRCVNNQANVRFWVNLTVVDSIGSVYKMFWSNDNPSDPKRFTMMFRWSCLAEGSLIAMADGRMLPIEQVGVGSTVRGDKGEALQVVDVVAGHESAPMVALKSDNGADVLVTQGHPFFDADGKPLRADELAVGSVIRTATGTTKVTGVERTPYAGKVYNLKLGTDRQIAGLDVAQISMYANGFRVGDSRSQWALELARMEKVAAPKLPAAEWSVDAMLAKTAAILK